MSNGDILKRAIEKSGWQYRPEDDSVLDSSGRWILTLGIDPEPLFFDHDFARAFWGDEYLCGGCGDPWSKACWCDREDMGHPGKVMAWCDHLQQLALEKDRLAYIEKFLERDEQEHEGA